MTTDGDYSAFAIDLNTKSDALTFLYHLIILQEIGVHDQLLYDWTYKGFCSGRNRSTLTLAGLLDSSDTDDLRKDANTLNTPAPTVPAPPTPAQRLERLKVIVEHLYDTWPHLLRRQLTLQSLGRNEDLHRALEQTYTAHITNTLQDVLVSDLLRELGALVLDDDRGSASVARAMSGLRDPDIIAELRREYEVVRPLGHVGGDKLTPEQRAALDAQWEQSERREQLERFERFRKQRADLDKELTESDVGEKLWQARSKGVAHYDVVRSGDDWRLWRVDGTSLTWGEINTYVDTCSEAIEVLLALVRQTSFDFNGTKEVAQGYVDEFIDALVRGLKSQKQEQADKRERLIGGSG